MGVATPGGDSTIVVPSFSPGKITLASEEQSLVTVSSSHSAPHTDTDALLPPSEALQVLLHSPLAVAESDRYADADMRAQAVVSGKVALPVEDNEDAGDSWI
jgi:hypothetical protein